MSSLNILTSIINAVSHFISQYIGVVIAGILAVPLGYLVNKIKNSYDTFKNYRVFNEAALDAVKRQKNVNGTLVEGDGLWSVKPIHLPDNYQNNIRASKILSVVNLKGGVGKTTISANLGACLAIELNKGSPLIDQKPVLLIDLDFQGTLSGMATQDTNIWPPINIDSHATRLICNELTTIAINDLNYLADGRSLLKIIPSYYELAQAENRIMIEWLLSDRMHDIRYTLAKILHTPQISEKYSLIILDCPPRLTTATIQALCASSHLLIPTIMDGASSVAVNSFARQVETYRKKGVCPYIKHIGVVGSITHPNAGAGSVETELSDILNSSVESGGVNGAVELLDTNTFIPRYKAIADNFGLGIVYPVDENIIGAKGINSAFENLAAVVKQKMRL